MERVNGGETGIRTLGTFDSTHTFQACALNHSAISPIKSFFCDNSNFIKVSLENFNITIMLQEIFFMIFINI